MKSKCRHFHRLFCAWVAAQLSLYAFIVLYCSRFDSRDSVARGPAAEELLSSVDKYICSNYVLI